MKYNNIKKGIIVIFIANTINLMLSLIRNFVLPMYLSIPAYAEIKTYQLYITFISIFALGYIDGMYLRYGGLDNSNIDKNAFYSNLSTFRIIQLFFSIVVSFIGVFINNYVVIAIGLTIIALNSTDYLKSFFQAVGDYKKYSNTLNASSIILFLGTILLLFVFKIKNPIYYVFCNVFVYYFVWIFLELRLDKKINIKNKYFKFSFFEMKKSISDGFILMIGLLISNFMTGLDRIFIQITLNTSFFAMYSFSAGMESFLNYAISPVAITLYNYFCKEKDSNKINELKVLIIIFLSYLISAAFPIKFIVENFITKYSNSIIVLFILFGGQLFYAIVRCFYINLYKANKQQKLYFKRIMTILIVGIIANVILFLLMRRMEAYAIGTMLTAIIWLFICEYDYKDYAIERKEKLYLLFILLIFLICGLLINTIIGFIVYILINTIIVLLFYKKIVSKFIGFKFKKKGCKNDTNKKDKKN